MEPIGNLLPKRLNKLNLQKPAQAAQVVSLANELSKGRFQAVSFTRGLLTVSCPNSIVAQEIQMSSHKLIAEINSRLSKPLVNRLRFRIGRYDRVE